MIDLHSLHQGVRERILQDQKAQPPGGVDLNLLEASRREQMTPLIARGGQLDRSDNFFDTRGNFALGFARQLRNRENTQGLPNFTYRPEQILDRIFDERIRAIAIPKHYTPEQRAEVVMGHVKFAAEAMLTYIERGKATLIRVYGPDVVDMSRIEKSSTVLRYFMVNVGDVDSRAPRPGQGASSPLHQLGPDSASVGPQDRFLEYRSVDGKTYQIPLVPTRVSPEGSERGAQPVQLTHGVTAMLLHMFVELTKGGSPSSIFAAIGAQAIQRSTKRPRSALFDASGQTVLDYVELARLLEVSETDSTDMDLLKAGELT